MINQQATDRLRREYFHLLPQMQKLKILLEANIKWHFKSFAYELKKYQRLEFESRIKECDSAIESLRRKKHKQGERDFDDSQSYSLKDLKDLIGIRILVFPVSLITEAGEVITSKFRNWETDHEKHGDVQILKYDGFLDEDKKIRCEIQLVPMLTGMFWEVEHSALYKPHPKYKNVKEDLKLKRLYTEILNKFAEFEKTFEEVVSENDSD